VALAIRSFAFLRNVLSIVIIVSPYFLHLHNNDRMEFL